jgi:hypothetical protein
VNWNCTDCAEKQIRVIATHALTPSLRPLCRTCYLKRIGMAEIERCPDPADASSPDIARAIREYTAALRSTITKRATYVVCPTCKKKTGPKPRAEKLDNEQVSSLENILYEARVKHGIGDGVKLARKGTAEVTAMKREFCLRARAEKYSYPQIAHFLGMNHTSVMHLVKT